VLPDQLLFAKTHEWVYSQPDAPGGPLATIGISAFAVEALTDLVYLEPPEPGRQVRAGESLGEIESVKAVSDIYSPVSGTVLEVNQALAGKLELLNDDPYGAAWIAKIRLSDPAELQGLLNYADYQKQCAEAEH
jgi:glycine cleavage system H protein